MTDPLTRRSFHATLAAGLAAGATGVAMSADPPPAEPKPTQAPFERDYPPPKFKPGWKKPQINQTLVQDFVIFAHSEFEMVKKLLEKEPALVNATMDWGGGDWESGLGGASHMGRRDIAEFLIERGARADIFSAAMLGRLDLVKGWLAVQPALIDAKGPHGFSLHFHAKAGGKEAAAVLEHLQGIKFVDLTPKKPAAPPKKP